MPAGGLKDIKTKQAPPLPCSNLLRGAQSITLDMEAVKQLVQ